jgi:hypothetical protein
VLVVLLIGRRKALAAAEGESPSGEATAP